MHKKIYTEIINDFQKGPIRRSLFSNGATLLEHSATGFAGAKININFLAGSVFENENQHGMAHIIEHLLFKEVGSSLVSELEHYGAEINAYTFKENVCFELSCLARKLEDLLPLFLDLIFNFNFTEDQFRKEKNVIIQELFEDKDDHETQGLEYIFKKNFPLNLGHPIGGEASKIKNYTIKDIQSYYKKYFTPNRLIITVVSGLEHTTIDHTLLNSFSKYFKAKEDKPFRIQSLKKSKKINHFVASYKRKISSPILLFSFDGPSLSSPDYYTYAILDEILFDGLSSLFFKYFRDRNPYVYGFGSALNSFSPCANYVMIFNTQTKYIPNIKKEIKDVLLQCSTDVSVLEKVDFIKTRLVESFELAFDDLNERAEFIADNEIYQLNELDIKIIIEKISRVSVKGIQTLAKKLYMSDYSILTIQSQDL